jgi:hypothetical protein
MEKSIKILLSFLFFLCLADMPYGFYQLVRFLAFVGFALLAYQANKRKAEVETLIYVALAILFQPFFKVFLGREIWNIIDVIVATGLLLSVWLKPKS